MAAQVNFLGIKNHILAHLNSAEKHIKLAVSWLTDKEIFQLLLDKIESGVAVSLITRNDFLNNHPDALDWNRFIAAGADLRFSRNGEQLHYKFILVDDKAVLCTSYNLTCFANGNNRENAMVFRDPAFVSSFIQEFEYLQSTLELQTHVTRLLLENVPEDMHGFYKVSLENDLAKQEI